MVRTRWLVILTLAALPMVGCSSPAASVSPRASVAVLATPTQAPMASPLPDLSALASEYKTLAVEASAARTQCTIDADAAAANLASARAAAQQCVDDYSRVVADFKAINWGPMQPKAVRLIGAISALDTLAGQMASAPTVAGFRAAYDMLPPAEATLLVAANALRAALGLPVT